MVRSLTLAIILSGAASMVGCEPPFDEDPLIDQLQGTWSGCRTDTTSDLSEQLTFSSRALTWSVARYATADGTCGGAATSASAFEGAFFPAEFMRATIGTGGDQIEARGLDVSASTGSFYTTVYVDVAAAPDALFLGDPDANPSQDTTSGAKRPTVLVADPLVKQ